jgi:uncharacterized protein YndB with AHSA1/START domain
MRDLITELNRTRRGVAAGDLQGGSAHVVALHRELRAPVADVWDACTDPDRVRRWFLPLSGDLRPGGTFQLEGNAGGTITTCEPPHRLELTWEFGDATPSRVSLDLTAADDGITELLLRHTVPDDEQWAQFGPGAVGVGWDAPLIALAMLLDGESPHVEQFTPALMRQSAAEWGAAHQAGGANPGVARDAAAHTSNFYAPAQAPDV